MIWKYSWKYSVSLGDTIAPGIENNGVASISLSTGHRNSTVKMKRWKDGNRGFVRSASKRLIIASLAARHSPFPRPRECLASDERVGGGNLVACNRVSCTRNVKTCEEALINSIKTLSGYSTGNVILAEPVFDSRPKASHAFRTAPILQSRSFLLTLLVSLGQQRNLIADHRKLLCMQIKSQITCVSK